MKMKNYTADEISSLIERFEKEVLPRVEWTHEAHLVVAIWYSHRYDFGKAMNLVRDYITNHNTSVGTPNTDTEGYHETITKFWLLVAQDFLKEHAFKTITEACNAFINSDKGSSQYPLDFYSEKCLFSVEARHNWLEPDLKSVSK